MKSEVIKYITTAFLILMLMAWFAWGFVAGMAIVVFWGITAGIFYFNKPQVDEVQVKIKSML